MSSGWAKWIVFTALLFLAPWPWYLVAVGGLLPVPATLLMALALASNLVAAVLLAICAASGIVAFYFLARWLANRAPALRPWVVGGAVGLLVLVSFQPIYGGGENIAMPTGKFADAYVAYQKELKFVSSRFADRTSKR